jgi:hypothetical protein
VRRPDKLCIKNHPKVPCYFDPVYKLSEKVKWSGFLEASRGLHKENSVALRDVDGNPPNPVVSSQVYRDRSPDNRRKDMDCRTWLREPCLPCTALARRGGSVGMSFTYRLNSTWETSPPWATPARMPRREDVAVWKDVWNVRQSRYKDMFCTKKDRKLQESVFLRTRTTAHFRETCG